MNAHDRTVHKGMKISGSVGVYPQRLRANLGVDDRLALDVGDELRRYDRLQ